MRQKKIISMIDVSASNQNINEQDVSVGELDLVASKSRDKMKELGIKEKK